MDARTKMMFYRRGSGEEERRDRPEGRFRDGRGRERYNDGRYAPRSDGDYDRRYRDEPMGRRYDIEPRGGGRSREPGRREMGHIGFEQQQDDDDRLSWEEAEKWVGGMKNADGTVGAKWAPDHVLKMMHERGIDCDPIEFWCAMNAVYSDFCEVLMDHGCTGTDLYLDLAKAWLEDKDAVPDKARVYYECIVE
ncbi:MAG: hypothetical protein ACLT2D_05050 [Oscillospiraceae bacterium]|jgi:hypothetical protein|nr:MAG TPA: hypothetical protein [Caudoviricetes sp.]DAI40527.1 MAG TPA: hypothetical protein [Caudoviricetes sp.]